MQTMIERPGSEETLQNACRLAVTGDERSFPSKLIPYVAATRA